MFANCQWGGCHLAILNPCLTPAAPPLLIPYPNIALGLLASPHCYRVLINFMPAHNMATLVRRSAGDSAGSLGGILSGTVMGQCRPLTGKLSVLLKGMPITRMTGLTLQNGQAPGFTVLPAQLKVMVM